MNKSPEIKNLAAALAKAQAEVGGVAFDSVNPHFKSKYASLAAYLDSMVEPFTNHGLSVSSSVEDGDKGMYLATLLLHSSGEWIEYRTPMILNKNDMQGLGSAETYSRRYRIAAIANVAADEDDDGNVASTKPHGNGNPGKGAPRVESFHTQGAPTGQTNAPINTGVKMPVLPKLSPDQFITGGKMVGKKIDELGIQALEDWAALAREHFAKAKIDGETSTTDIARTYRAVRAQAKLLQPSMFEAAPSGGLNS